MTQYERWSIVLTAIGHVLVLAGILYAARQWSLTRKAFERDRHRDTTRYIAEIRHRVVDLEMQILTSGVTPQTFESKVDSSKPVVNLLNAIEELAFEIECGHHGPMLADYGRVHAARTYAQWKPVIYDYRQRTGSTDIWSRLELLAMQ